MNRIALKMKVKTLCLNFSSNRLLSFLYQIVYCGLFLPIYMVCKIWEKPSEKDPHDFI